MICEFFGKCGGCALPLEYEAQLDQKTSEFMDLMSEIDFPKPEIFESKKKHFRNRAEFMVLRTDSGLKLGMSPIGMRSKIAIKNCPITNSAFSEIIEELLLFIGSDEELSYKLFGINFLANTASSDLIVVLIYHKKLDEAFAPKLDLIRSRFDINIIARSRGVKLVAGDDYVIEQVLGNRYRQLEGSFTQPNGGVNSKMIGWVLENSPKVSSDLLELYCGNGNFTIALASRFRKVVAIEIAKSSLATAKENAGLNGVENIFFARMDAAEFAAAYNNEREFVRLKDLDLMALNIQTVFVDPPRAGLDSASLDLIKNFKNIIYISCNPQTLFRDLKLLDKTHKIVKTALFDQFAYTPHLEAGVILEPK